MFLVGLTGGIASGKSIVGKKFQDLGVNVIDGDVIAREVVEPGKKAWKKIKAEFGPTIVNDDGEIDRKKLGDIVFSDSSKRKCLNKITHPEIYKQLVWEILKCLFKGHQFVILDLPLLLENCVMTNYVHKVIVVSCEEDQQLHRLMTRNNLSEEGAMKRIGAQMPLKEKCKKADFVIDNSQTVEYTHAQVETIYRVLRNSNQHWKLRFLTVLWVVVVIGTITWLIKLF